MFSALSPQLAARIELRQEVILIVDDRATTLIAADALGACHGATIGYSPLFDQRSVSNGAQRKT